jgi:hypothetical protein
MSYKFYSRAWGYEIQTEDGPATAFVHIVKCQDDYGKVWDYVTDFSSKELAAKVAESMAKRVTPEWTPNNDYWTFYGYAYGSQGYCENGCELEQIMREKKEADGCY